MVAPFLFADNARSTLGASLSLGGTTITLASGGGAIFPNPAAGQQFALTLNDLATQAIFEVVWCTQRAGDVLTVVRAQEGTTAKAWGIGDYCWNGPTSGQMNNFVQIPHMTDASIAPVFGATQIQGTLGVTGPATFSSTGQFGAGVTVDNLAVQGVVSGLASIALLGSPGATGTPNKYVRSINGILDIVNSAGNAEILTLTDFGDLGAIRNLSARGSGTFAGPVASGSTGSFVDPTGAGGVIVSGPSNGAAIALNGSGNPPNKYIRSINGAFQVINSAFSSAILSIDDAGNTNIVGNLSALNASTVGNINAGGIVAGQTGVQANAGNVTAFGGRLRATFGARGSADPNAACLLADFVMNSNGTAGYLVLPNNSIIQFGFGVLNGDPSVPEFFPIAFPTACASVVCTEGAAAGSWFVGSPPTPTIHAVSGFAFNAWYHAGVIWSESNGKIWIIANLTTSWMAFGN